eukprot:482621-Pyramimonas_sp.AAC.1
MPTPGAQICPAWVQIFLGVKLSQARDKPGARSARTWQKSQKMREGMMTDIGDLIVLAKGFRAFNCYKEGVSKLTSASADPDFT